MTAYFAHICFFILSGVILSTHAQRVYSPKIYRNRHRCNCENNKQCNIEDGSCPGDKCARGYFGINCQHANVSLAMSKAPLNVHTELLDGDDTTCMQRLNGSAVFQIDNLIHFIWVYIFANTVITVKPILTLYNDQNRLNNQYYQLKLTENSILIKSSDDVMYKKLELSNLPKDTCSVEISIGRNLAISSAPEMLSETMVDGSDINTVFYTLMLQKSWSTRLLHDARINHILVVCNVIHSRNWSFIVELTLVNGTKTNIQGTNKDDIHKTPYYANIPVGTKALVKEFAIKLKEFPNNKVKINEVYIFGEFHCPKDKYGETCERHCPVRCGLTRCDPEWACAGVCDEDWEGQLCEKPICRFRYGQNCEHACPDGCAGLGLCDSANGTCVQGCKPGYAPPLCTTTCLPGTFATNCAETCSNCERNKTTRDYACDPITGDCLLGCGFGFRGDYCERIIVLDNPLSEELSIFIVGYVIVLILLIIRYSALGEDVVTELEGEKEEEEEGGGVGEPWNEVEVVTNQGEDVEVVTKQGEDVVVVTNQGKDVEVVTKQGKDVEVITKQGEDEVVVTKQGKDVEVVTKQGKDVEVVTNQGKDVEVVTKQGKDVEVVTKQGKDVEVVTKQGKDVEVVTKQDKDVEVVAKHGGDQVVQEVVMPWIEPEVIEPEPQEEEVPQKSFWINIFGKNPSSAEPETKEGQHQVPNEINRKTTTEAQKFLTETQRKGEQNPAK